MKKALSKITHVIVKMIQWFFAISIVSVVLMRWIPVPVTPLMIVRCAEQLADGRAMKLKKDWEPLENISSHLPLAVVCSEDQNFLNHHGFDFGAIERALEHNKKSKRKRGASTISQQTAKNVFLWPGRSWIRKGLEVYFTALIELFWSKERIMEVYLNIIETGDGVYGAQASAQQFFKKDAKKLSKSEAALIAAVLPNPLKYSIKKPSGFVRGRQAWVMRQMFLWGGVLHFEAPEKEKKKKK